MVRDHLMEVVQLSFPRRMKDMDSGSIPNWSRSGGFGWKPPGSCRTEPALVSRGTTQRPFHRAKKRVPRKKSVTLTISREVTEIMVSRVM